MTSKFLLAQKKKSDAVIPSVGLCIVLTPFPCICSSDGLCFLSLVPYCIKPPN